MTAEEVIGGSSALVLGFLMSFWSTFYRQLSECHCRFLAAALKPRLSRETSLLIQISLPANGADSADTGRELSTQRPSGGQRVKISPGDYCYKAVDRRSDLKVHIATTTWGKICTRRRIGEYLVIRWMPIWVLWGGKCLKVRQKLGTIKNLKIWKFKNLKS